jgi:TatD DNase family protein
MAKSPPPPANEKKSGGLTSAFKAFSSSIDEIVNEVKRDLRDMTPQEKSAVEKRNQDINLRSQSVSKIITGATAGVAENEVYLSPVSNQNKKENPTNLHKGLPEGNLWHALVNPTQSLRLRVDACYHALTIADIESYTRALHNEVEPPYTLGLISANIAALSDEEAQVTEGAGDLLTQTLLKVIQNEPRVFGAVGAGPRQLWQDTATLDEYLTKLLNENPKIIALGPLGLDEPYAPYTLPAQQQQLKLQLEIAADFGIPAFISTRKTHEKLSQTISGMAKLPQLVYLDALTIPEDADLVKNFNMYVLLRPELTQPEFIGSQFYRNIPLDHLLLASGSALVAPHGFSGHFNQPKFLMNSLEAASKKLNLKQQELHLAINNNMVRVFGLSPTSETAPQS